MELDELKKLQASMEDTARSMRDSVQQGISEAEGEINKVAQSAKVDPYDNPFADPPAAPPADPYNDIGGQGNAAAAAPPPQAELPLDEGGRRKTEGGSDAPPR
jgi:hypothetical protein